jgi:hypothetical protein
MGTDRAFRFMYPYELMHFYPYELMHVYTTGDLSEYPPLCHIY